MKELHVNVAIDMLKAALESAENLQKTDIQWIPFGTSDQLLIFLLASHPEGAGRPHLAVFRDPRT